MRYCRETETLLQLGLFNIANANTVIKCCVDSRERHMSLRI
jgi:hypothetical protein